MQKVFYPVVFHPEEVGYSVSVPDIDGCFTQGDDMNEAVSMVQEAMGLMLEDYFDSDQPFPAPSAPDSIHLEQGEFVAMVEFDELEYRKQRERQAVKKTLSIPGWLNNLAEKAGINFSQVLQEALKQRLGVTDR
ncbi:MAG: type II toxin-antitoxin system HicB family antitoxin [Lawsonibacter sp.]|nr:type II toxin-antitoxin system HicB family antitoxin [Lawsonibacter sp.]